MKKQTITITIKFSLAALSLALLTACGGGGSGGSSTEAEPVNPAVSTKVDAPATPAVDTPTKADDTIIPPKIDVPATPPKVEEPKTIYSGNGFKFQSRIVDSVPPTASNVQDISTLSQDLNSLIIDGKTLSILPSMSGISGVVNIKTLWQSDSVTTICCGKNNDINSVKIGHRFDPDTKVLYAFYQGSVTPDSEIPTSGEVSYLGKNTAQLFTLSDGIQGYVFNTDDNSAYHGDTELTANFADKTVKGSLYTAGEGYLPGITFQGDIVGSQINGEATIQFSEKLMKDFQVTDNTTAPLTGAFFGQNAEEVAGEAHNSKWGVVFAAEKQQ